MSKTESYKEDQCINGAEPDESREAVAAHLTNECFSGPPKFYNNFNQNDCSISLNSEGVTTLQSLI